MTRARYTSVYPVWRVPEAKGEMPTMPGARSSARFMRVLVLCVLCVSVWSLDKKDKIHQTSSLNKSTPLPTLKRGTRREMLTPKLLLVLVCQRASADSTLESHTLVGG